MPTGLSQETLGPRFEISNALNQDGSTVLARDRDRDRPVVIHVIPIAELPATVRHRLEQTAALGEVTLIPRPNHLFVARPFVEGVCASELGKQLSTEQLVRVAAACLRALRDLHASGVLHGNIKPSNVIVQEGDEAVSLVDAALGPTERLVLSIEQVPLDAVRYLAPEQAGLLRRPVGKPSDLYALGLVLFTCLSGAPAFAADTMGEILDAHLRSEIPDVRALGVRIPRALAEIVGRLVREDPDDRYQSAGAALADLEAVEHWLREGVEDPPVVVGLHDVRSTLTEPGFVGMGRELIELERCVAAAHDGNGGLIYVEGESGSGKTRLLQELGARARASGAALLVGHAAEQAVGRPFHVLSSALSDLIRRREREPAYWQRVRERLGAHREIVLSSLPELEPILGPTGPVPPVREALAEVRALTAVSALLDSLAEPLHPALILLEDMQWADPSTLKLLSSWATRVDRPTSHVAVIATFRTEEVAADAPLRTLSPMSLVRLERIEDVAIGWLLQSAAGPLPELATNEAVRLAAGNPFMALAVLHGMVESLALVPSADVGGPHVSGGWIADSQAMKDLAAAGRAAAVLSRRLDLLPPDTRAVLSLAAILGRVFDTEQLSMLAALAGQPAPRPAEPLQIAVERHLVWPARDGNEFWFAHDAIRETLLAKMGSDTKVHLHRVAATMLERRAPPAPVAIAFHFDACGDYERALPHALEAAADARRRLALATAERQYLIAKRGMATAAIGTRKAVLVGHGEVLLLLGRYDDAYRALEAARPLTTDADEVAHLENLHAEIDLNRGDAQGAAVRIASALRTLGERVPQRGVSFVTGILREAAVQAVHTLWPRRLVTTLPPLTASEASLLHLYRRLAYALYFTGTVPVIWAQLRELNLAERHAPGPELGQACADHAILMAAVPLFGRALRYSERALEISRQRGDIWSEGQALHFHARVLYAASRMRPAIEAARASMRLLERAGDRWEYDDAAAVEAQAHLALGNLTNAVSLAKQLYRASDAIGDVHPRALALQLWAHASGGDVPAELIEKARAAPASHVLASSSLEVANALRLLHAGEVEAAIEVLEEAYRQVRHAKLRVSHVVQIPLLLARALRTRAAQLALWEPDERARLLARAHRLTRTGLLAARTFRNNLPHALREAGVLAAISGRRARAIRLLDASCRVAERQGARYELAQSRLFLGQLGRKHATEEARRQLIELGAEFALGPAEKPIVLSLADRFTRLLQCGRKIVGSLERDEIFAAIEGAALQTLRAELCEVRPLGPADRLSGNADWERLLQGAAREGHAITIPDGLIDAADTGYASTGARSALWGPIFMHGQLAAALFAKHSRIRGVFTQDELRVVDFLATLAGAALENAEGFQRAQQAIAARDEFLQIASHEIRTPLTPFKLNLQLLETMLGRDPDLSPPTKARLLNMIESMGREVERLSTLLDQVLEASNVGTGVQLVLENVDLGALLESSLGQLRHAIRAAGSEIRIEPHERIVGRWDPLRLKSVITSLLGNALKFGEGKKVLVSLSMRGDIAVLRVQDFGIGIAPRDRERLFQRLERAVSARHFGGLGLGLYLSQKIVQAHGGTLRVESSGLGQGSTFIVELPLVPGVQR